MSWILPRLVGLQHGLDLLLSARKITAAEALAMGLVTQVKPAATLQEDVAPRRASSRIWCRRARSGS